MANELDAYDGDLYSPNSKVTSEETRDLASIILDAIDAQLVDVHTWLPGVVTQVLPSTQQVNVQPSLMRTYNDGKTVNLPIVQNVPLWSFVGQTWGVKPPVAVGDEGILLFCERSLDTWKPQGGVNGTAPNPIKPNSARTHHLADPVFIPGLRAANNPILKDDTTTDLIVFNGEYRFRIGTKYIQLGKANQVFTAVLGEVLNNILNSIISQFNEHVHTGNLGAPTTPPTTPMDVPDLDDEKDLCSDEGQF